MRNSSLINPYSPSEQQAFYRWIVISRIAIVFSLICCLIISCKQWYAIQGIKHEVALVQQKIDISAVQRYEQIRKQHAVIKEQLATLRRWKSAPCYYEHVLQLSEKIPDQVRLSEVLFEDRAVTLKGEAHSIEYILSFIHNMHSNTLFQEMNLIELQPSSIIYQQKNLVYFVIKGKLL